MPSPQTHQLPADGDCLFCKIIAGAIPCLKVYEDENVLAFLDINPIAEGHTLIVPKGHYPTVLDLPEEEAPALIRAVKIVGAALQKVTGAGGFNCVQNNFAPAGQVVFHSHWHIIPRSDNDGIPDWTGKSADPASLQQLAQSISAACGVSGGNT